MLSSDEHGNPKLLLAEACGLVHKFARAAQDACTAMLKHNIGYATPYRQMSCCYLLLPFHLGCVWSLRWNGRALGR